MGHHIIVMKSYQGELGVFFSPCAILKNAHEKEQYEMEGDRIIAEYPLDGSLQALGILVSDSTTEHDETFGNMLESLLTTLVQDMNSLK